MPEQTRAIVPASLRPYTLPLYRAARSVRFHVRNAMARIHPRPILVLGNQKSGTTAIAALLGELTGLSATLDLQREMRDPVYDRVSCGEMPFERLVRRNRLDFSRPIIKEPHLTIFIKRLQARFPDSPVVFVIRDPRDNLRSILNRLELPGYGPPPDKKRLAAIGSAWRLVLQNEWLGITGGYIEQLAQRWKLMAQLGLDQGPQVRLVRYEDFLHAKVEVLTNLAQRLGAPVVADIRHRVDFPFQPPGDHSVTWDAFFGDNLETIQRICAEEMDALGYDVTASAAS